MYHRDTITSLATAAKESALGLIRVSGKRCLILCKKIFDVPHPTPRKSNLSKYISTNNEYIDQVIFIYYADGKSFTGEDMIEITFHGNIIIADKILKDLINRGCRLAEPGEFTRRSFLNGKIDLTQAESIAEIISAKSDLQLKVASKKLSGALGQILNKIQDDIITIQTELEAIIDFPEDDISDPDYSKLIHELEKITTKINNLNKSHSLQKIISDSIKVTLVGPPNAGKSSLFNKLLSEDRSIVSDIPGTTRDYVSKEIVIHGHPVELIDTAGIRESENTIEKVGIENTKKNISESDIVFLVIDITVPYPTDFIQQIKSKYPNTNIILIRNKTDLNSSNSLPNHSSKGNVIDTSVYHENCTDLLFEVIIKYIDNTIEYNLKDHMVVNQRQFEYLNKSLIYISNSKEYLKDGKNEEVVLQELKIGLEFINCIVGSKTNEDMLDKLFSNFCIGK